MSKQGQKKGPTEELIAKYEAGTQPVGDMVKTLLDAPDSNTPAKVNKQSDLETRIDERNARKKL